jgi:hypothetical protein
MLGWLDGLSRLVHLRLSGQLNLAVVDELSRWPGLARLEQIELHGRHATPSQRDRMHSLLVTSTHYQPHTKIEMKAC